MRKGSVKHPSDDVQGPGSYVVIKKITWGEMKKRGFLRPGNDKDGKVKVEQAEGLFAFCITEWNWTDEQNEPLPLPRIDPSVVDGFTDEESAFLLSAIIGSDVEVTKKKRR